MTETYESLRDSVENTEARLGLLGEEEEAEARETFEEVSKAIRRRLAAIRGEREV